MKIPKIKISDVLEIDLKDEYSSLKDFIEGKSHQKNLKIDIDLERWGKEIQDIEAIAESFEYPENSLFEYAGNRIDGISLNSRTFIGEIELKFDDSKSRKDFIEETLNKINNEIKEVVEEKIGVGFKKFLQQKEEESQDELFIEYHSEIRKYAYEMLKDKFGDEDFSLLLNSDAIPAFNFDMREDSYRENSNKTTKLSRNRKELDAELKRLSKSKYIKEVEQVQRNNPSFVHIRATEDAKKIVKETLIEATEKFYNNPRYKIGFVEDDIAEFIGRVNDGKGNDADIYKANQYNTMYIVREDNAYCGEELIRRENKKIFNAAKIIFEDFKEKQEKTINTKISGMKRK